MTSSCPKCGMPIDASVATCRFCNTSVSAVAPPVAEPGTTQFRASGSAFRIRGKFEDLVLHLIDLALFLVTLGVGGLIWSVVLSFSGQTPAGRLRDQVLVNIKNSAQASAWRLIVRQLLTFLALGYLVITIITGFEVLIDVGGYYFATYGIPGIVIGLMVIDSLALLSPIRRRLIDWLLSIRWADGNGHSFRNYKPQSGF